ncbi:LIM domain-containing protein [Phthorimaea operculella]|nr:LIM domain-containing protein [Phthorimaea operculella]
MVRPCRFQLDLVGALPCPQIVLRPDTLEKLCNRKKNRQILKTYGQPHCLLSAQSDKISRASAVGQEPRSSKIGNGTDPPMGVFEERGAMHWQQSERYLSSAYEGGGELSPVAPAASPESPRDCSSCRKREPPDEPQESEPPPDACAGCGARITDRYYLLALERRWHTPCLRCCECKMPLDSEQRCYARDSNIFCKNDYFRLYGSKRCARCNTPILASEMVMRARDLVFHVPCFSCAMCNTPLNKGDTFGIRDSAVYCRLVPILASEMVTRDLVFHMTPSASGTRLYTVGWYPPWLRRR